MDVKYVPRTLVADMNIYGEDALSIFEDAITIEMYPKDVLSFGGEGDIMSRLGMEIRDSITFAVSERRFRQSMTAEPLLDEENRPIIGEEVDIYDPTDFTTILQEETTYDYSDNVIRPREGDLIWMPIVQKLFEIKKVEHEDLFYQFGFTPTWELICELMEYSSERLNTGDSEIDAIEDTYSQDQLAFELLGEDSSTVTDENEEPIIEEDARIEDTVFTANNERITINSESIFDRSEKNRFGEKS